MATKHKQQPSNFQNNTISPLAISLANSSPVKDYMVLRVVSPTNQLSIFKSSCPPKAGVAKGKGRRWMAEGLGQPRLLKP